MESGIRMLPLFRRFGKNSVFGEKRDVGSEGDSSIGFGSLGWLVYGEWVRVCVCGFGVWRCFGGNSLLYVSKTP